MTRRTRRRLLPWLLLAACSGDDGGGEVGSIPVVAPPTMLLAGCEELELDGTCTLGPGASTLRVWIDQQEHAAIRVVADGVELETHQLPVDGGVRLEIELPELAQALTVEGVDPRWQRDWSLALRRRTKPAVIVAADEQLRRGDRTGASARLEAALDDLADDERLAALQRLQALDFAREDLAAAAARAGRVVALAQQLGQRRAAARAASTVVFIHAYQQGDLAAARPALEVLDQLAPSMPEAAVWAAFSHGIVARAVGDTTRALESFREAAQVAERLGMHDELLAAREALGTTYAELARGSDAVALARRILADAEQPRVACQLRYTALNTAGWVQLLLLQRQVEHLEPLEFFERALALVEAGGECPSPQAEVNVRINLALTALAEPDPAMALAWLEPVELVPPAYEPWVEEVEARAGLALGRWSLVPSPMARPDPSLPRAERWNALMRQAAILEAWGMRSAAIDAYADAETIVEESLSTIGVDLGRELYLSGRQASARGLVRELVRAGREDEALCHARLARARALRMLDRAARLGGATPEVRRAWEAEIAAVAQLRRRLDADADEDWKMSSAEQSRRGARRAEQHEQARKRLDLAYERLGVMASVAGCESLPGLDRGEVMLLPFPLDEGWLVFVADGTAVWAHAVSDPPVDAGAGAELGAWSSQVFAGATTAIEGASRLRILPTGRSWDVPFHALAWREGVLLDVAPVSYALDLAKRGAPALAPGSALVVADPHMDLPLARDEAEQVAIALERSAWTVERLEGRAVTRARFEASLADASLLHYAGHGEHDGTTGWGARLLMGEGEGLGVTDVLALAHAPTAVVLSGCETGRTVRDTLDGGMNIGRAFILAGSQWVVAVDRRVSDELSSAVGQGIYAKLAAAAGDGPRALREVQLELRSTHPEWDWAAFRAIVR